MSNDDHQDSKGRRLTHLYRVLLGIRKVHQLVLSETDPCVLIDAVCDRLTEALGYNSAWAVLLDSTGTAATAFGCSGMDAACPRLRQRLRQGDFPRCMHRAMEREGTVVVTAPQRECPDCPASRQYDGSVRLCHRLAFDGRTYGCLTVSLPSRYAEDEESRRLFAELAEDLALCLHRHQMEWILHEREQRFRSFVENANDIIFELTPEGRFGYVSPNWPEFMGEPADAPLGAFLGEYVHPHDLDVCRTFLKQGLEEGRKQSGVEYRVRHRDGSWRWHLCDGSPLRDPSGEAIVGYLGIARDTTERKRVAEELRNSHMMLSKAEELSRSGSWQLDLADGASRISENWRRILGLPNRQIDWEEFQSLCHPDDLPRMREAFNKALAGEQPYEIEHRLFRKSDGACLTLRCQGEVVFASDGRPLRIFGMARDVTEELATSEMLHHAQKMESVGRLAGGVAHDFNNMLGVIIGHADLLLYMLPDNNPLHNNVREIRSAAQRSADLARQLLAFARKQTIAPKVMDLNETVASMLDMLRRLIGENIDLKWQPADALPPIFLDPSQIDQVLANLCVNARDAIDHESGTLVIETGTEHFENNAHIRMDEPVSGNFVTLSVSDDGCGMAPEIREKIFDPFFTTKNAGEGTGLGLATVYGIVRQNAGFIDVDSVPGTGTTFRIYLPAHADSQPSPHPRDPTPTGTVRGHETILLVEDEKALLNLTGRALRGAGYRVLEASAPQEALRMARECPDSIDLLVTDVVMPEMNGRELADELRSEYPRMEHLFVSGYSTDIIARHGVLDEGLHFLQKPIRNRALVRKVRDILDRRAADGPTS